MFLQYEMEEPICNESLLGKYSLMQPRYPEAMKLWKEARESNWEHWEIDYTADIAQINNGYIKKEDFLTVLIPIVFFNAEEGVVGENCVELYKVIEAAEFRLWYAQQIATEAMHAVAYQNMFEVLVTSEEERNMWMDKVMSMSSILKKRDWAIKWKDTKNIGLHQRLFAFACIEGIHFSTSFAIMGWLQNGRTDRILPGIHQGNEHIRPDEYSHVVGYATTYKHLLNKLDISTAMEMIESCVEVEIEFVKETIQEGVVGISVESLSNFVKFMADTVLGLFNFPSKYNQENPFTWMSIRGLLQRVSAFEVDTRNYIRTGTSDKVFNIDSYEFSENF